MINNKLQQLQTDSVLIDSIGGINGFEMKYNKLDFIAKDSFEFHLTIKGMSRDIHYEATHIKKNDGEWLLLEDNLVIE